MQRLITKRFAVAMLALCVVVGFAGQVQSAKKGTVTGVINVNNATREELMQLPGIGKVKADAIITYREQHRFEVPQDLTKVSGIGTALFNQLQEKLPALLAKRPDFLSSSVQAGVLQVDPLQIS